MLKFRATNNFLVNFRDFYKKKERSKWIILNLAKRNRLFINIEKLYLSHFEKSHWYLHLRGRESGNITGRIIMLKNSPSWVWWKVSVCCGATGVLVNFCNLNVFYSIYMKMMDKMTKMSSIQLESRCNRTRLIRQTLTLPWCDNYWDRRFSSY